MATLKKRLEKAEQKRQGIQQGPHKALRNIEELIQYLRSKNWESERDMRAFRSLPDDLQTDILRRGPHAFHQFCGATWTVARPKHPFKTWPELALAAYREAASTEYWPTFGTLVDVL